MNNPISSGGALPQVLICDDDQTFHLAVKYSLKGRFQCRSAMNGDEALAIVRNHPIDLILLDVQMRTPDEGLRYLPRLKEADEDLAIIMSSGLSDFKTVKEALKLGATDYVPKDFDPNELMLTLERALERRSLLQRNEQINFEAQTSQSRYPMVGTTPEMLALRKKIEKFRQSNANVLILGETGTGKEVVARQLRRTFPDGTLMPFVAVDSSTIQGSTAESHLFGHEKGAFTGADKTTKGIFEEANGGIVYFDEVANMSLEIQAKLLRVLQEKEITRMGSARVIPLEFRVVCATNRDLDEMVKAGLFKDDLVQRLNVLPIELPPLRDRREDIPALVAHFIQKENLGNLTFNEEALKTLQDYSWPGNIRELGNLVSYVLAMTEGSEVEVSDLPPKIRDSARNRARAPNDTAVIPGSPMDGDFYSKVAEFEKKILAHEYQVQQGNVSQLALALGMDRSHLYAKLREYGIHTARTQKPQSK
ncbi:MAG: sigma-54-dependent Fis family transcriptional regulator [Methylotenera sp.]|nr:sigma-54-dependent Fis family transcriptional regulator [Oligoflexia bacterium]